MPKHVQTPKIAKRRDRILLLMYAALVKSNDSSVANQNLFKLIVSECISKLYVRVFEIVHSLVNRWCSGCIVYEEDMCIVQ